jgi:hypothetical protein
LIKISVSLASISPLRNRASSAKPIYISPTPITYSSKPSSQTASPSAINAKSISASPSYSDIGKNSVSHQKPVKNPTRDLSLTNPQGQKAKALYRKDLGGIKTFSQKGLTSLGKTDRFIKVSKNKRHTEPGQLKSLKAKLKHS